jgi:membrane protein implicated in regulation of membrane protease activity
LYGLCLALSIVLAAISAFSGDLLDVDVDADMDVPDGAHGGAIEGSLPRYTLFNPIAFLSLLGGFGAVGLIMRGLGVSPWLALPVALAGGVVLSFAVFQLFARVVLASEGTAAPTIEAAIGKLATVTVSIPNSGLGVVAYVIGGQRVTLPARHVAAEPVASGAEVVIVDLEQNVALVRVFPDAQRT